MSWNEARKVGPMSETGLCQVVPARPADDDEGDGDDDDDGR